MKIAASFYFILLIKIIYISNINSNYSFKYNKKSSNLINNNENSINSFSEIKNAKITFVNNLYKNVNEIFYKNHKTIKSKKLKFQNHKKEKEKKQSNRNKKKEYEHLRKNTELECYISCETCTNKGNEIKHLCNKCKKNYYPLILKNENNINSQLNFNCYKNTTLIDHYYFDEIEQKFNECSQECLTCFDKATLYDTNCLICDYNKHYIPSIYDFSHCIKECGKGHRIYISENNNFKNYLCTVNDNCPSDYPIYNESLNQCFDKCDDDKFLYKNTCIDICPNDTLIDDLHKICYNIPKNINNLIKDIGEIILSIPKNVELNFNYGSIKVIVYNNSYSENLLVNFTECLNVFKSAYNLNEDNFLFSKIEYINQNSIVNKIEYLVFDENGKLLNLSVCSELNIKVNYIITNETNIDMDLAKKFLENDIDIFNEEDNFFNDICYNFTSENGTDVTLNDRKESYFQNISLCQKECTYLKIDLESKIVECVCPINSIININEEENKIEDEDSDENESSFTSNNYEVILCYNKVFNKKILKINIGNFIMLFIGLIYFILILEYAFRGRKNIALYIVLNKYGNQNPPKKKKNNNSIIFDNENFLTHTKCKSIILSEEINIDENKENKESIDMINIPIIHNNINEIIIKKESSDLDKIERHRKNINILSSLHNNYIIKPDISSIKTNKILTLLKNNNNNDNYTQNHKNNTLNNNLLQNNNSINHSINSISKRTTNSFILGPNDSNSRLKKKNIKKNTKTKSCIEYDEMSFQSALLYDKRNIFHAYWEELKDKQIFLCLFFNKHLMLKQLKIASFLIGTATDFFFNAFFYTDKYISKNYNDGALEYVTTLPKTILSSILTQLFCCFLEYLISSKTILLFLKKKIKKNNIYYRQCNSIINMCICKIRVFILVTSFSLIFFWYYITAFCAVYQNSQINWIKDALNSFWISLLTPLALCFFSLLLRNISIKKKNKVLFYISKTLMIMV